MFRISVRPADRGRAQSPDGKAAYVQVNLAGNQGQALSDESVRTIRQLVDKTLHRMASRRT